MRDDDEVYEQEIGLTAGHSGRTLIEEDADNLRPFRYLSPWELDYKACCLKRWHDIHQTVQVNEVDDETTVFGHPWRLSDWQQQRKVNKFTFPGVCPEHGQVRLAPRGVVAHLPRNISDR